VLLVNLRLEDGVHWRTSSQPRYLTTFYDRHFLVFRFSASRASTFYRIEPSFIDFSFTKGTAGRLSYGSKSHQKFPVFSKDL
jgi:hypothetical protein